MRKSLWIGGSIAALENLPGIHFIPWFLIEKASYKKGTLQADLFHQAFKSFLVPWAALRPRP
jgi:hypothetical protein